MRAASLRALVAEHEEQQAEADREEEQDVDEHAVEHAGAEAAQQRVVEMVQAPQHEAHASTGARPLETRWRCAPEHDAGPDGDGREQQRGDDAGDQHAVHAVDGDPRPDD